MVSTVKYINNPFPKAELKDGKLVFECYDGLDTAIKEGIFFIKIPKDVNIKAGSKFCSNFYKNKDGSLDDSYRGFKEIIFNNSSFGYTQKHDQIEQIQLEMSLWEQYFPSDLTKLLCQINYTGEIIINEIFRHIGIPQADWKEITGASLTKGLTYSIFNHFRSEKPSDINGCKAHKDSGFVTLLCMEETGQEVFIDDRWLPVIPIPDHYVINIGLSFEILTKNLKMPVKAPYHRAVKTEHDRHTFGVYIGPRVDMNLYQYNIDQSIDFHKPLINIMEMQI